MTWTSSPFFSDDFLRGWPGIEKKNRRQEVEMERFFISKWLKMNKFIRNYSIFLYSRQGKNGTESVESYHRMGQNQPEAN